MTKSRLASVAYNPYPGFDAKTEYQKDIDRVIFSSAFRRLQDKTQVMPMPASDYVRSRLTHSVEVSTVGRSLGKLAGEFIINKERLKNDFVPDDFANVVIAASLAHDIGNPPFGHTGEKAIGNFFKTLFENESYKTNSLLSDQQKNDLIEFEGNAAGFRILTNDHPSKREGGLRLTYATLGAFAKYPCSSVKKGFEQEEASRKSLAKYGFFHEEESIFKKVAFELDLLPISNNGKTKAWCRHPLAFLMEAADTLTYHIIDYEDGCKLGFLNKQSAIKNLELIAEMSKDPRCKTLDWKKIKPIDEKIGALRAKVINALTYECIQVFKDNYSNIMCGAFDDELTDCIPSARILSKIKDEHIKENFYRHSSVLDNELVGFEVIEYILTLLIDCVNHPKKERNKKFLLKLPKQFSDELAHPNATYYKKLIICTDFVSRMTDGYALSLYRKLKGIEI